MKENYCIYYFSDSLVLLPKNKNEEVKFKLILSKRLDLQIEEAKEWIKTETNSSFLHSEEFLHVIVGSKNVLLPSKIFDENQIQAYYQKVYEECEEGFQLITNKNAFFGVNSIETLPFWALELTSLVFHHANYSTQFTFYLEKLRSFSNDKTNVFCMIHPNRFFIGINEGNKLIFFDDAAYSSAEDILYFLLNCIQKCQVLPGKSNLYLGHLLSEDVKIKFLELIVKIADLSDFNSIELDRDFYFESLS